MFLDLDHVNLVPLNNAVNQLVNTEDGAAVRDVMIGGRFVLRDGVLPGLDWPSRWRRGRGMRRRGWRKRTPARGTRRSGWRRWSAISVWDSAAARMICHANYRPKSVIP